MEPLSPNWLVQAFGDESIDEVLINGCHSQHTIGPASRSEASPFASNEEMRARLQNLAYDQGQRLDPLRPAAGGLISIESFSGRAPLHLRWHALIPPIARDGPLLSLRRHRLDALRLDDFISAEDSQKMLAILENPVPPFVIGPTASG